MMFKTNYKEREVPRVHRSQQHMCDRQRSPKPCPSNQPRSCGPGADDAEPVFSNTFQKIEYEEQTLLPLQKFP